MFDLREGEMKWNDGDMRWWGVMITMLTAGPGGLGLRVGRGLLFLGSAWPALASAHQ